MPKKFIKRFMPDPEKIRNHKHLRIFGKLLHDPNLLHLNRRSASGAVAVGLFFMWIPVPFQMLLAAAGAIYFRVNLIISVPLVWITNPLTMPPMFYFAYLVGSWVLQTPAKKFEFELSMEWLGNSLASVGPAFLLGCLILAVLSAALGYASTRLLWRWQVVAQMGKKKRRTKKT
jgi:hypothetical protein